MGGFLLCFIFEFSGFFRKRKFAAFVNLNHSKVVVWVCINLKMMVILEIYKFSFCSGFMIEVFFLFHLVVFFEVPVAHNSWGFCFFLFPRLFFTFFRKKRHVYRAQQGWGEPSG